MVLSRVTGWYERTVARARQGSELVDHGFRAKDRYAASFGGRLAAAIAYYGFFASFALGLVGYSVLGLLLERRTELQDTVRRFLAANLPVLQVEDISAGAGTAGLVGLVGLVLAGLAWVDALRASQRQIWELEQEPGNPLLRRAVDVLVLLGLALLIGASVAVAAGIEWLLRGVPVLRHFGWLLEIGINLVVAVALLAGLPRLRISPGRLLPAAAAVAVGILLLNTLGGVYIDRVRHNPAYTVVATAAGLLVYLYLFHQLLLAGAAWVATARRGRVRDLAAGSGPEPAGPVGR
ncbi:MAG: YhjD/YihY/BrkB family envelope integrity protein [Natronosporangium sp.]